MDQVNATLSEIRGQTEAWKEAITVVKDHQKEIQNIDFNQYQQAIFLGCGSTYYLSLSAASLFQQFTGIYSKGLPSSEVLLNPRSVNINQSDKTIFCAVF
jgi:glucosamine--fructose-6-phosphate aminotransferase (isomerizing)